MAVGAESAVQAIEIETFATQIPSLIPRSKTLYALFQEMVNKVPVSNQTLGGSTTRPSLRVPMRSQGGAALSQGTGDGDLLPAGNASQYQDFVISPVMNFATCQINYLAQLATAGKKRGLIEYKATELKNSLDSAMAGIEALYYSDGSGLLTQIPSNGTVTSASGGSSVTGQTLRPMAVTDNQVVQFFAAEGGSSKGTATVLVTSPQTSTIYFTGGLTSGSSTNGSNITTTVVAGDYIMIAGSTGASGAGTQTSVLGLGAWQNSSTSGSLAGVSKSTYPTRLSTPVINLNNGSVVASLSARIEALLGRAMGEDNETKDSGFYIIPEDQAVAIANSNYYNKQLIYQQSNNDGNTGSVPDVSKKYFQATWGGRKAHTSYVQPNQRIDLLLAKNWTIADLVPLQLHNYGGGNTVVPVPGAGSYYNANQFTYEVGFNLADSAPVQGLYITEANLPII